MFDLLLIGFLWVYSLEYFELFLDFYLFTIENQKSKQKYDKPMNKKKDNQKKKTK